MAVTLRSDRPTLGWRILPPVLWGARRGHRLIERNVYVYRRTYMIILSGFFEPVFYLVSIRLGLGTLVGDVQVGGTTVSYAEFVAPALLATSAMNGAIYDSTMNVFFKLKYAHIVRRGAGHADGRRRRRAGRDRVGAHPRARSTPRASSPSWWRWVSPAPPWAIACLPVGPAHRLRLRRGRPGRLLLRPDAGPTSPGSRRSRCRCSCSRPPSTRCRSTRPPRSGSCGPRRSTTGWRCAGPSRRASCPGGCWPTSRTCWSWASSGCWWPAAASACCSSSTV